MFKIFKKLVQQTAIYGLSTIVGRLLNYLLVPFYTRLFLPAEFGVMTELYAYVGFLLVFLTYGLETGYFRHANHVKSEKKLFSSLLFFVGLSSIAFILLLFFFKAQIGVLMGYPNHIEYILYLGVIVALDAFLAIPFARLRFLDKPVYFASAKLINISLNIGLTLFFYLFIPYLIKQPNYEYLSEYFTGLNSVKYVFISNLVASAFTFILLIPQLRLFSFQLDFTLLKKVLHYSFPLLLVGFTGIGIDSLDKILLKHFITVPENIVDSGNYIMSQIGIYGANFKLAVFMSLFIQAYRFASEPLFFAQARQKNAKDIYAAMMKYFVIFGLFIFLSIMLYLDIVKLFIAESYYDGLYVVPILLLAKLMFGIVFNLSIWYKVTNLTKFGIYVSLSGLIVSVLINVFFIPKYSFEASAWAALFAYFAMACVSYVLSRKHYLIKYSFKQIGFYFILALSIFILYYFAKELLFGFKYILSTLLLIVFVFVVAYREHLMELLRRRVFKSHL